MPAQSLTCPECDAPLKPPPGQTRFFCAFCGSSVAIPPEYRSAPVDTDDSGSEQSEEPLRPAPNLSKFTIDRQGDLLTISWSWRSMALLFLIPFAVFWNAITWIVGGTFLLTALGVLGNQGPQKEAFIGVLIASPHFLIGLGFIYAVLVTLFNRTMIEVDRDAIRVVHGPIPWKSPPPLRSEDVEQLYVKRKTRNGNNGSVSYTYELQALRRDGEPITLLKGERDENTPRAVERMIEVHLGIKDRRVHGEVS